MATDKKSAGKKAAEEVKKVEAQTEEQITQEAKPVVKKAPTVAKRSAKKETGPDPEEKIGSAIGRTEQFIYNNGKSLLTALVVVLIIVGGFLAYWYLYLPSRSQKAGDMMFVAQQQFEIDSFAVALNGDGNYAGFLEVIDKYGSTPEGNIAKHYAGICFLKTGDLDNALAYLEKYKTTKGAPNQIINAQNVGLQGDILVQKGEYGKAADKFNKAIAAGENSMTTPMYLKKLAFVYQKLGKNAEAEASFQRILDEFPMSMEARDVEKYMGQQEQK